MLSLRFWGVRGSIPCPGRDTVEFGGNTSCLEIRADERIVIVDLGTGVKPLGDYLIKNDSKKGPLDMDIFISHTHWDHIMGFPMFTPVYAPGAKMRIWGPASNNADSLASIIGEQLSFKYWPVGLEEFDAEVEFRELGETSIDMGSGLKITTKYLNHSIACLGYRFEYQGKSIVTAFDHEPFTADNDKNGEILSFFRDAGILVHDTQYLPEEFEAHLGWGHSSYDIAVDSASNAGVKKLVFFHHDPKRKDEQLQTLLEKYKNKSADRSQHPEIIMAREGLTVESV